MSVLFQVFSFDSLLMLRGRLTLSVRLSVCLEPIFTCLMTEPHHWIRGESCCEDAGGGGGGVGGGGGGGNTFCGSPPSLLATGKRFLVADSGTDIWRSISFLSTILPD